MPRTYKKKLTSEGLVEMTPVAEPERVEAPKRRMAPNISVNHMPVNERKNLIEQYAPECLSVVSADGRVRDGEFHAFFGDGTTPIEDYKRQGYEPITRENGEIVRHRRDPLFRIPTKTYRERIEASAQRAKAQADAVSKPKNPEYAGGALEQIDD